MYIYIYICISIYIHVNIYIFVCVYIRLQYIFFPYIFSETQRNKKNAVQTTKFGVVPPRKVPYVHVSHGHYSRKLNDIYK